MPQRWTQDVVIPTAADGLSSAYDFGGGATYIGLIMSALWTAGNLTFQVSKTIDGTYYALYNEAGSAITVTSPTAAHTMSLNTAAPYLSQFRFVKVKSSVQQGAARTLTFIFER